MVEEQLGQSLTEHGGRLSNVCHEQDTVVVAEQTFARARSAGGRLQTLAIPLFT